MNRIATTLFVAAVGFSLLGGCNGPVALIPGGALEGSVSEYPSAWDFASEVDEIALETTPGNPRSVTTWSVVSDGSLYIPTSLLYGTEDPTSREWVQALLRDDLVRVGIEDRIFEGRLRRVLDARERARVIGAFLRKYDVEPAPRVDLAWVFKLSPREHHSLEFPHHRVDPR